MAYSLLTEFDNKLIDGKYFSIIFPFDEFANNPQSTELDFQFPPLVSDDKNSFSWNEVKTPATETIPTIATPDARGFTVDFTYSVDPQNGWPIKKIKKQLQILRLYAYAHRIKGNLTKLRIVKVRLWDIGGKQLISARLDNVSIKYSDSLATFDGEIFPLYVEINLGIKLWTKSTNNNGQVQQNTDGLSAVITPEWY